MRLASLQYKQVVKLIQSVCWMHSKDPQWETSQYQVCLWLYSLLALFRVKGGMKYHEVVSEINFICSRDNLEATRVLRAVMVKEFGQVHLR